MTQVKEVAAFLDSFAPPALQESYDNSGLLVGDPQAQVKGVLISLDVTEEVVEEAHEKGCNLIVSHHPLIFGGLKRLTGRTMVERCLMKALHYGIALYAGHTNFDSVEGGVNARICQKLGMENCRILAPVGDKLSKLVTFVPVDYAGKVREAIFNAGAGQIGAYDQCSFNLEGEGTFRGGESTNPFVGVKGETHFEKEVRVETVVPNHLIGPVVKAMNEAHPYEEVAYDLYGLKNSWGQVGIGMVGELPEEEAELDFLKRVKDIFKAGAIKYTKPLGRQVRRVAVVGGSGSGYLGDAIASEADVFLSADFKYHDFFSAEGRILVADIGHFESEQYTTAIFYEIITKKFTNFAVRLAEINTNPIKYL